jgi:peroxiredoxin
MGDISASTRASRSFTSRLARWIMAAGLSLAAFTAVAAKPVVGQPAPDFALKSTGGENLRLSEYRGQPVLVAFWASWCGRCSDQLQALAELKAAGGGESLQVLAVNIDQAPGPALDAARRLQLTILHDADQAVARLYDPANLPFTVLVDADGRVRQVYAKYRAGDESAYASDLQ